MAYFSRGVNVAKAVALVPFTNLVGPLIFILLRKDRLICAACQGLLPVDAAARLLNPFSPEDGLMASDGSLVVQGSLDGDAPLLEKKSRRSRFRAWVMGAGSLMFLGLAAANPGDATPLLVFSGATGFFGVMGAFKSGKLAQLAAARRQRQRTLRLLDLAREYQGRLTVTDVAARLRIDFAEAEQALDSIVDGRRVDIQVDADGRVSYIFPELARALGPSV